MLRTKGLAYSNKGKWLVKNLTLQFLPGTIHGIMGPNGAGKSTILKLLCGIWPCTEGSVVWGEANLFGMPRREISKIISMTSQGPSLNFDYSVEQIVEMGRYPLGKSRCTASIKKALCATDLLHLSNRPVNQLSQGEKQRVYIARGIASETPVLLLDEPTANLDMKHQLAIWNLLSCLASQGKTVIVATHDLSHAKQYCAEILLLQSGE